MNITQKLSYGVYAVTTWHEGTPQGCIANCAIQITANPATFAVSIHHDNYTNECIKDIGRFAVSVLATDSDPAIIGALGFKSGRNGDKFAGIKYAVGGKMPIISDSCGFISCEVIDKMETPTHTVFLGKLAESETFGEREPMTYDYYHKVIKGKSPKNAPTYTEDDRSKKSGARRFRCTLCGYEYEGDELPEGYQCPICGVGMELFEEIK